MTIDIDEAKVEHNAFGLWLAWTLATTLGMVIGYLPAALIVRYLSLGAARIIIPILAGVLLGAAQWLVLRNYVTNSHDWIFNQAGGWVIGFVLGLYVAQALAKFAFGAILGFIFFGVIVALFQWPVLRREVPHLAWWIVANVIGWALGAWISDFAAGAVFQAANNTSLVTSTIVTVGTTGLIAGAVTALALIWIVRQPEREDFIQPVPPERGGRV